MSNRAKWRNFSKEEIEQIVKNSQSVREVAKKLGYSQEGGGMMASLKRMFIELNIDTSHFKGQGWNKGNYCYETFTENTPKKRGSLLQPLIALRGKRCESCGITSWMEKPISLQVHHIDGNRNNNNLTNLKILCPNCHSQTENFAKKKSNLAIEESTFVDALTQSKNIHQALVSLGLTPSAGNYTRARRLVEKYKISHLY